MVGHAQIVPGQRSAPQQQPVAVQAEQIAAGEQGVQPAAGDHGSRGGHARFGMADRCPVAQNSCARAPARAGVETEDVQAVLGCSRGGCDVTRPPATMGLD